MTDLMSNNYNIELFEYHCENNHLTIYKNNLDNILYNKDLDNNEMMLWLDKLIKQFKRTKDFY